MMKRLYISRMATREFVSFTTGVEDYISRDMAMELGHMLLEHYNKNIKVEKVDPSGAIRYRLDLVVGTEQDFKDEVATIRMEARTEATRERLQLGSLTRGDCE